MSQSRGSSQQPELAPQILGYLLNHPQAQDSFEGILHWWLLEQQITYWKEQVQTTLDALVAQKLLLRRTGRDGRIHYRVNRRRLSRIHALLAASAE